MKNGAAMDAIRKTTKRTTMRTGATLAETPAGLAAKVLICSLNARSATHDRVEYLHDYQSEFYLVSGG